MTLTDRLRAIECDELRRENVRLRASRDSLQVLVNDLRRQVREQGDVLDLRENAKSPAR